MFHLFRARGALRPNARRSPHRLHQQPAPFLIDFTGRSQLTPQQMFCRFFQHGWRFPAEETIETKPAIF